MAKTYEYSRAREHILHHILSCCLTYTLGSSEQKHTGFCGIKRDTSYGAGAKVGDLVILAHAPASKFQIGWLRDIRDPTTYPMYLIESLEDGTTCWWHNVALDVVPEEQHSVKWKWSDKQFAFHERWLRTFSKNSRHKTGLCSFDDTGGVRLSCKGYWDFSLGEQAPAPITLYYTDWRKITIAMMKDIIVDMDKFMETRETRT